MSLQLYNTLTRKKEGFKPLKPGIVSGYACGPTVYSHVHIGNFRAMVFYDLVWRSLRFLGYEVKNVMNITDVDDKTIRDSQKEGKSLKEFTEFYTDTFLSDMKELHAEIPEQLPRATEEIECMVQLTQSLIAKGFAYKTDNGDVYFSIAKFLSYGSLAQLDLDQLKKNADGRLSNADEYDKENARDFALWKAYDKKDGDVFWDTSLGKGRPGWHIECSAMSSKYLGQPFDIHMGGVDLIFPHHTNEIAQSEAVNGKKLCNVWMHNAHLIVDGEKMSKSLGNVYSLGDIREKGFHSLAFRYVLLQSHYRSQMNFTWQSLDAAQKALQRIWDFVNALQQLKTTAPNSIRVPTLITDGQRRFTQAIEDDLNTPEALAVVFDFMTEVNKLVLKRSISADNILAVLQQMKEFDKVFALIDHTTKDIGKEIIALIEQREEAREQKNFAAADRIRDELYKMGIVLEDTHDGVRWKRK